MNILQIGCNSGSDHVYDFLAEYNKYLKKAILVDAEEAAVKKAREKYSDFSKVIFKSVAVVDNDAEFVDFCFPEHLSSCGHASLDYDHVALHERIEAGQQSREAWKVNSKRVPAVRINKLLGFFENKMVERLYIDVEGFDCQLIDDIDFKEFKIGYIKFEHVHSDGTFKAFGPIYQNTVRRLTDHGFSIIQEKEDTIALHMA